MAVGDKDGQFTVQYTARGAYIISSPLDWCGRGGRIMCADSGGIRSLVRTSKGTGSPVVLEG